MAVTAQLSQTPFDDRQLCLLDRVENIGLCVRYMMFTGIATALLFDAGAAITMTIAGILLIANAAFFGKMLIHGADDWLATQVVMAQEQQALAEDKAKAKRLAKMARGEPVDETPDSKSFILKKREDLFTWIRNTFFFAQYRSDQLLRLLWTGPGSDAAIYIPHLYAGVPLDINRTRTRTVSCI